MHREIFKCDVLKIKYYHYLFLANYKLTYYLTNYLITN